MGFHFHGVILISGKIAFPRGVSDYGKGLALPRGLSDYWNGFHFLALFLFTGKALHFLAGFLNTGRVCILSPCLGNKICLHFLAVFPNTGRVFISSRCFELRETFSFHRGDSVYGKGLEFPRCVSDY